jgi:UDP-glucose:glycoprotein glucosyltransferase
VQAQLSLVEDSTVEGSSHGLQVWRNGGRLCTDAVCEGTSSGYKAGHTTKTMQFDRLQGSGAISDMWTVYDDPTSADFPQAYQEWRRGHPGESTAFRLRLKPPHGAQTPLVVNGYGVELALKRTDYIVIDDREAEAVQKVVSSSPADINLEADDDNQQLKPLTSSELLELGTKAASYVMSSNDPLDTLARVSRDFPKYASALAAYETSSAFVTEHKTNQLMVPAGMNVMWINGVQMNARDINAFTLLEHLRKERKLISGIEELGFSASESIALLSHEALTQVAAEGDVQRYDWRDATEGGKVIIWMNNLEKDKRYAAWPKTAQALLQRVYPGQLPQVAVDLQNIVLPIDITKRDDLVTIVDTLQNLVKRQISARFGIVPITASPLAAEHAKVMYYLCDTYGLSAVMAYLETVAAGRKISAVNQETFTTAIANRKLRTNKTELSLEEVLESATYKTSVDSAKSYLARLGADKPNAPYFANGAPIPSTDDWLQTMSNRISTDLRMVQMAIFEQRITDDDWLPSVFLETASFKRNPLIVPEDEASVKILDMGKLFRDFPEEMAGLELDHDLDDTNGEKASLAIILDLNTYEGAETAIASYEFSQAHPDVDIMVRHTSGDGGITDASVEAAKFVLAKDRAGMDDYLKSRLAQSGASAESEQMSELATAMGLEEGARGLMINGRVVKIPAGSEFTTTDFADLLAYERQKRIAPVLTALKALVLQDNIKSSADLARLTSLVALSSTNDVPEGIYDSTPGPRINIIPKWQDEFTCIKKGDREAAQLHVVALLDPVSEVAQQWVPIMKVLSELDGVHLRIYLNPQENLSELPIKRFFRQVLRSEPLFDDAGKLAGQSARFSGVPQEALLTVTMHTPPSWLVAPKVSVHDLDNIKLSALKGTTSVTATYELEHILIEGHSRDVTNGNAPRGVQLALSTENDAAFEGTIIMANLGYFQFKVNPGVYNLALQRGRSTEIFNLDSAGILGETGQNSTDISLLSFQGSTLFPRLSRKPGKRTEDVLEPSALSADNILAKGAEIADDILAKTGLSNTKAGEYIAAGLTFGQKLLTKAGMNSGLIPIGRHHEKHADINIFSVASGHLYERMLNIMMVSVTRHTKHTVKFWFIEQFLSPSFKQFLPHMAAHYNFRYEMVTYAWPHWLRAQKEKQRVIWGYKILFLDVLFPLDLDKVIFVDADQIVRTDMYELVTHDLEGAPYGFTPMCDSRTEMEGYRFWKQGYWKNFLRGSPYHISALYVVDLKRFRQIAAGDRLRQQYHQLSADPASLSNLDQDLPNHMQHALPIHSLPQEWLWCETWCSDESLKQARTIDLCNNPQTKEPKLDRARRQVPEWTVYDDEIAEVARAVREREGGVEEAGDVPLAGGVQEDEVQGAGERVVKAQESGAMPAGNAVADGEEQQVKDEL